jgi:hypothetical protein
VSTGFFQQIDYLFRFSRIPERIQYSELTAAVLVRHHFVLPADNPCRRGTGLAKKSLVIGSGEI